MEKIYSSLIEQVRNKNPLVHHITNYVTVNDCANITLAIGGSPIMADTLEEIPDIVKISSAVVLNIGTLNQYTVSSMLAAGRAANKYNIPVILDPVGVGISSFRNNSILNMLNEIKFTVIRGNISEIRFLAGYQSKTLGVDASPLDIQKTDASTVAKTLSNKLNCVIAITGETDIISSNKETIHINNGNTLLSKLTGTGCMCSSLIGSFCGTTPSNAFNATVASLLTMSIAGEIAYKKTKLLGTGSFHIELHNAISNMNSELIRSRATIYEIEC